MMDINNLIAQVKLVGPELMKGYCIINGDVMPLEQIEKMDLNEFSTRSVYNIPMRLYKFFPDTEKEEVDNDGTTRKVNYSTFALESNDVYLSSPSDFDDVYDSEINIPWNEFERFRINAYAQWAKCRFTPNMSTDEVIAVLLQRITYIVNNGGDIESTFDMEPYGESEKLRAKNVALRLKIQLMRNEPSIALKNVVTQEYEDINKELKEVFRVACFTTAPMSQLMWGGSYANKHNGFCLEYTVIPDKTYEELLHNIRPVVYSKARHSVTQALLDAYDKDWDISALRDLYLYGALRKSIDWAYQNEWRLLLPPRKIGQHGFTMKFFPITKVYLGNRMPPKRRKEIIAICKQRGIPYVGVIRSPDLFEMQECKEICENYPRLDDMRLN